MARCVPFGSRCCAGFTNAARVTRKPNGFTFFSKIATRSLREEGGNDDALLAPAAAVSSPLATSASATTSAAASFPRIRSGAHRDQARIRSGVDRDRRAERQLLGEHRDGVVVHA